MPQTYTVLLNPSTIGRAVDSHISENLMAGAVAGIGDPGRHPNDFLAKQDHRSRLQQKTTSNPTEACV